jgi:hypothetical protein
MFVNEGGEFVVFEETFLALFFSETLNNSLLFSNISDLFSHRLIARER